jgi:hypothetical protein
MILTLGSQPKLKLEKENGFGDCFEIQSHSHKCEKMQRSESQHSMFGFSV